MKRRLAIALLAAWLQALHRPHAPLVVDGGAHVRLDQGQAAIDREMLAFFAARRGVPVGSCNDDR